MLNYYRRFFMAFWKDFRKATGEQMIGALIALAILLGQIHYGVIKKAEVRGNELAIVWPYAALVVVLFLIHLVRAPWKLDQEHQERHGEHEKHASSLQNEIGTLLGRPNLTAEFKPFYGASIQWILYLHNSSSYPAVDIFIKDVSLGPKVLRFDRPAPIYPSTVPTKVDCHILENGIQEQNNVLAIFRGNRYPGQHSPSLVLKIVFSNLESKANKKSWELSVYFWYDYLKKELTTGEHSVESI